MQQRRLKQRQRDILQALNDLGGTATTREVALRVRLSVNGVSQSLGALFEYVQCHGGRGGEVKWSIKKGASHAQTAYSSSYI